jgi:apolipoprotein N-acyltransferase
MEWLMAHWFGGFGWSALGYSQGACLPIAQWAAGSNVSVISLLIVLVNLLLALVLFERPRWGRLAMTAVLMVIVVAGGYLSLTLDQPDPAEAKRQPFKVGVIQPSVSQEIKWDPYFDDFIVNMLETQTRALAKNGPLDLVVWPEAAVPGDLSREKTLEPLRQLTKDTGASLLTGITRDDAKTRKSFNSACLISPQGEVTGVYDKVHLAPFGEYIPFEEWFPFLRGIAFGGVDAGEELKVFQVGDRKTGPLICFEVLFAPLSKELKRKGADFLVIMTNLAWFGKSNAMLQELEQARFRAIETGLPLVHCGNTGISGVFDGSGRFVPVTDLVRKDGSLVQYPPDRIAPAMVQTERLVGTFTLPAPIKGMHLQGHVVLFACFASTFYLEFRRRLRSRATKTDPKQ